MEAVFTSPGVKFGSNLLNSLGHDGPNEGFALMENFPWILGISRGVCGVQLKNGAERAVIRELKIIRFD